jgi:hypothetical protein
VIAAKTLIPRPARYLLRFDDLCATVSRERWQRCVTFLEEFQIQPILAVVPDNQDPELQISPPDLEFWHRMRSMERAGAMIGLHGYRHLCRSSGRSLLPLHRESEFAGVPAETQHTWIREGLRILREHGLDPRIWVAPRHGFDHNTLLALRAEGIQLVSDGFACRPFIRDGLTWIPQQLWAPVDKPRGLWTICVHPNTAGDAQIEELRAFLRSHANQFTSVDHALAEFKPRKLGVAERVYEELGEKLALWRIHASQARRYLRERLQKRVASQTS